MSLKMPRLTIRRLSFLTAWLSGSCRDPLAAARHAGFAEPNLDSTVRRLLRSASLRHFARLMAPEHARARMEQAFSAAPEYTYRTPKRLDRVAEIVAAASRVRAERERRRHRVSPWLRG
jgi:hypothetical protein